MFEELFLEKIRLYRMRNGYTQEEMAQFIGYKSKRGYNNLERGKVKMSLEQFEEIIRVLSIPMEEITEIIGLMYQQENFLAKKDAFSKNKIFI